MTLRRLSTPRQSINEIVAAQQQRVRMGVLVAIYPGTGDYMHVQMTNPESGASTIVRARVGVSGITTGLLPVGTPVSVTIRHGQPTVVGVAGTGTVAGANGGGGGAVVGSHWVQFIDSPLTTLELDSNPSDFRGTWTAGPGYAIGTADPDGFALLNWYVPTEVDHFNAVIVEAEVAFPTGSNAAFGISLGNDNLTSYTIYLDPSQSVVTGFGPLWVLATDQLVWNITQGTEFFPTYNRIASPGIVADTFYKIRAMRIGSLVTCWVNDSYLFTYDLNFAGFTLDVSGSSLLGAVDGVNTEYIMQFRAAPTRPMVMKNNALQFIPTDYTYDGIKVITMASPPSPSDVIAVGYEKAHPQFFAYIGVWAAVGEAHFRNFKAWRLGTPWDTAVV